MAVEVSEQLKQVKQFNAQQGLTSSFQADTPAKHVLLHELQLGEKLNHSVVDTRRADFSLMLAMLAEDVREQSQFLVPKAQSLPKQVVNTNSLRKSLNLPDEAPLALSKLDDIQQFNQAETIINQDMATIHLTNAIQPKPLAFRDDKAHIGLDVVNNMSIFAQLKLKLAQAASANKAVDCKQHHADDKLSEPLSFNANAWLDSVQTSIVQAPIMS